MPKDKRSSVHSCFPLRPLRPLRSLCVIPYKIARIATPKLGSYGRSRVETQRILRGRGGRRGCFLGLRAKAYSVIPLIVLALCLAVVGRIESALEPSSAWAAGGEKKPEHGEEKKVKKLRKREDQQENAENKKGKGGSEQEEIQDAQMTPALGTERAFGHKDFDASLEKQAGVDAVLIIDASRSMQRTDPERLRDQGAKLFVRFLSEGDRVALIEFEQETKVIVPLTPVSPDVLSDLDSKIEGVSDEGNFTDLRAPVVKALEMLSQDSRPEQQKCVVLLSDGKMDPHPSSGTKEDLINSMREVDLPLYRQRNIKLYTLALSEEADKTLLGEMANITGGLHWYAQNADTIHKIFSDLFLTLKKPQVVALEGSRFEVDDSVTEATFFISRKNADLQVTIVDPQGKKFNNDEFPTGVKWYRGDLFDVVTVRNPLPGPWGVQGVEEAEGYATLLTDLKLQVRWPESNLRVGDSMAFMARLIEKDETAAPAAQLSQIVFFSYKVIDNTTGQLVNQGGMSDQGEDGDQQSGDRIFTQTIKIDKEGEYKALISATGPTFSRQQIIPFNVSAGLLTLTQEPANEFTGQPGGFKVTLSNQVSSIKKPELLLIAQRQGEDKALAVPMDKYKISDTVYGVPVDSLEKGEYKISVRLAGVDAHKKKIMAASETIDYVAPGRTGDDNVQPVEVEVEALDLDELEASRNLKWGLFSCFVSLIWSGGFGYWLYKSIGRSGGIIVAARTAYAVPEGLENQIAELRKKSSTTIREPTDDDYAFFDDIKDVLAEIARKKKSVSVKETWNLGASKHEPGETATKEGSEEAPNEADEPKEEE
jgi:uncharacterized protein (TIGR03503 family)